MISLSVWFLFYLLPIGVAGGIAKLFPTRGNEPISRDAFVIHVALLISILGSQYALFTAGRAFPWSAEDPFIFLYAAGIVFSFLLLRSLGLWYALSALLQQACMLSMAFVLYEAFPLWGVVLLVVPIYTLAHLLKVRYAWSRMALFFAWGAIIVLLFPLLPSVWLFAALHTIAGAVLIRFGVLYPRSVIPKGFI